jgi:hypothetical protein
LGRFVSVWYCLLAKEMSAQLNACKIDGHHFSGMGIKLMASYPIPCMASHRAACAVLLCMAIPLKVVVHPISNPTFREELILSVQLAAPPIKSKIEDYHIISQEHPSRTTVLSHPSSKKNSWMDER